MCVVSFSQGLTHRFHRLFCVAHFFFYPKHTSTSEGSQTIHEFLTIFRSEGKVKVKGSPLLSAKRFKWCRLKCVNRLVLLSIYTSVHRPSLHRPSLHTPEAGSWGLWHGLRTLGIEQVFPSDFHSLHLWLREKFSSVGKNEVQNRHRAVEAGHGVKHARPRPSTFYDPCSQRDSSWRW